MARTRCPVVLARPWFHPRSFGGPGFSKLGGKGEFDTRHPGSRRRGPRSDPRGCCSLPRRRPVRVLRAFLDERGAVPLRQRPGAPAQCSPPAAASQGAEHGGGALVRGNGSNVDNGRHGSTSTGTSTSKGESDDAGGGPGGPGPLRQVAVSLSGGVDSMALCRALVHLRPLYGFEVMGIHIDYGNRHESGREADFVEGWCQRHGVAFHKRAISEVRRSGRSRRLRGVCACCAAAEEPRGGVCLTATCLGVPVMPAPALPCQGRWGGGRLMKNVSSGVVQEARVPLNLPPPPFPGRRSSVRMSKTLPAPGTTRISGRSSHPRA